MQGIKEHYIKEDQDRKHLNSDIQTSPSSYMEKKLSFCKTYDDETKKYRKKKLLKLKWALVFDIKEILMVINDQMTIQSCNSSILV